MPTAPLPNDTDAGARAAQRARIATLSKPERLARTLELSALMRDVAWAGALHHERGDPRAARARFLAQLYGRTPPEPLRRLLAKLGAPLHEPG